MWGRGFTNREAALKAAGLREEAGQHAKRPPPGLISDGMGPMSRWVRGTIVLVVSVVAVGLLYSWESAWIVGGAVIVSTVLLEVLWPEKERE